MGRSYLGLADAQVKFKMIFTVITIGRRGTGGSGCCVGCEYHYNFFVVVVLWLQEHMINCTTFLHLLLKGETFVCDVTIVAAS